MNRALHRLAARLGWAKPPRRSLTDRLVEAFEPDFLAMTAWINTPHPDLGWRVPGEAATSGDADAVHALITREFGVGP